MHTPRPELIAAGPTSAGALALGAERPAPPMIAALFGAALFDAGFQTGTGAFPPALESLIEPERAFARAAGQKGIRHSFLEYFDDDALALTPKPQSAKQRLRARPARPFSELELTSEPRTGDAAAAGDLGWLTGPSTLIVQTASPPHEQPATTCRSGAGGPIASGASSSTSAARCPSRPSSPTGLRDSACRIAGREATARQRRRGWWRGQRVQHVARHALPTAYGAVLAADAPAASAAKAAARGPRGDPGVDRAESPVIGRRILRDGHVECGVGRPGVQLRAVHVRGEPSDRGAYVPVWARDAGERWWLVAEVTEPAS